MKPSVLSQHSTRERSGGRWGFKAAVCETEREQCTKHERRNSQSQLGEEQGGYCAGRRGLADFK